MLSHIAYISKRKKNCTDTEIEKILGSCEKNNPQTGITGILLYDETQFLQYVEGDATEIDLLFNKISKDERHEDVIMVSIGIIKEKMFPSWHMASQRVKFDAINYRTDITDEDREAFKSILSGQQDKNNRIQPLLKIIGVEV